MHPTRIHNRTEAPCEDRGYVVETFVPGQYAETVDRNRVRGFEMPMSEYRKELKRLLLLKEQTPANEWEPCTIVLKHGDDEILKETIV